MPPKKTTPSDDRTTFSAVQKTVGRRIDPVEKETAKLEALGRVRFRCIDSKGGYDGMRIIHEGEVFDLAVTLLETRAQHEENVQRYQLSEVREFIAIEGIEYVVPKWCEPAPDADSEFIQGHHGVHGNAGAAIA